MSKESKSESGELSSEEREILEHLLAREQRAALERSRITPRVGSGDPPTSFAQQRLWILGQLEATSAAYNLIWSMRLIGELDIRALRQSLVALVSRHEALRTTFALRDGEPVQVIAERRDTGLEVVSIGADSQAELQQRLRALSGETLDLSKGPLFRAVLFRLGEAEHVLSLLMHHSVSDGWSFGVLYRELSQMYAAYRAHEEPGLPALPIQYADYAVWQRKRLREGVLGEQLAYWREQLTGAPEVLELPTDRPRPAMQTFNGAKHVMAMSGELRDGLKKVGREGESTLYMVLLAAFAVLLSRYTGQHDIVVGTPIAGRDHPELEGLIGFFVNTVVMRTDLSGEPDFKELLARVRHVALDAYAHQDVPFQHLVETLRPERRLSHSPVFQVMFILQNAPQSDFEFPGVNVEAVGVDTQSSMFDLTLSMDEHDQGLRAVFEYNTDLFDRETIERLASHYQRILEAVVADTECPVSRLPLMGDDERQRVLVEWNDTYRDYPRERCIHELFEEQVERTPDAVALECEGQRLTYAELNRRANRLAHHLGERGIEPGAPVGLCVERSLDMVVSLMGVLKAGGAYVPLDPSYPAERLALMMRSAGLAALLTQRALDIRAPAEETQVVYLEECTWSGADIVSERNPGLEVASTSAAYIIYTSGSTGLPKGVAGTHRGAVNRFAWMWHAYPFSADEVCCQKTSLGFVDSVWEVFGPLLQSVPSVIIKDESVKDPKQLIRILAAHRVTRIVLVPSLLSALLDAENDLAARLPRLRLWVCSGETLPVSMCRRFQEAVPGAVLLNLYGSSEVAGDVTCFNTEELDEGVGAVPIGRPIANTRIYVCDTAGQPMPIGIAGELCVGGDGVANGYWCQAELTAERFIEDPYSAESDARLYRMGDLARWRTDGSLDYLGRKDRQVKIRGFRVELGDVEAMLANHPSVDECAVALWGKKTDERGLVAYVVPRAYPGPSAHELRQYLEAKLPHYMVPFAFVALEAFPLTPSGKIDRQNLPPPDGQHIEREQSYVAPRSSIEEQIVAIWAELLVRDPIGVYDDFFSLGGHSLLAARVMNRITERFGVDLPLLTLFEQRTVSGLSEALVASVVSTTNEGELGALLDELEES
uniref:NRPS n=1 Tax=uncultured bacterium 14-4D TaxID=1497525 RepID=A0A059U274_9BACT|nr:NRPS [uncultured bacterium 14-4D]